LPSMGTRTMDASPTQTVGALKQSISHISGIPSSEQRLVFGGKSMEDKATLQSYGVEHTSNVHVLLRVVGGAQLGKAVKGRSRDKRRPKDAGPSQEELLLQEKIRKMQEYDKVYKRAMLERKKLKAAMAVEERNSRVNRLKIQNQWRKIMRLAKLEQLRKDIEILSQSHERDVDRKDAILQMLDRDLEEAEEQFQMAHRAHLQNVDKLIDLQDARLLALENEFEKELSTLEDDFQAERDAIVRQHALECAELHDIMSAVANENAEAEAEARQEHEQTREEIRNKNLEDINVLRITLDGTIEELEQHFEAAHLNYLQNTDQRTADFKHLTSKDQELSKEIEVKMRKIERLQASSLHWRTKIAQNVKECHERNRALQEEKDTISMHFQALKNKMNKFREGQEKRLLELTKNVQRAKGSLQERLNLAAHILTLSELARKCETEREKVLPLYASSVADADAQDLNGNMENVGMGGAGSPIGGVMEFSGGMGTGQQMNAMGNGTLSGDAAMDGKLGGTDGIAGGSAGASGGASMDEWSYLDNFWKRYNKALLDKLAIEKEKQRLQKENGDLQSILKQYIDGISVNEVVMGNLNPLLVVNGRINLNQPKAKIGGNKESITVVEGNHMVETARVCQ